MEEPTPFLFDEELLSIDSASASSSHESPLRTRRASFVSPKMLPIRPSMNPRAQSSPYFGRTVDSAHVPHEKPATPAEPADSDDEAHASEDEEEEDELFQAPPDLPSYEEEELSEEDIPLPPYTCDIHYEDYVYVKYEFSGDQKLAHRPWNKRYMVVHGTSLKIYKEDWRNTCDDQDRENTYFGVETQVSSSLALLLDMKQSLDSICAEPTSLTRASSKRSTRGPRSFGTLASSLINRDGTEESAVGDSAPRTNVHGVSESTVEPATFDDSTADKISPPASHSSPLHIKLPYHFTYRDTEATDDVDDGSPSSLKMRAVQLFKRSTPRPSLSLKRHAPPPSPLIHHYTTQHMEFRGLAYYKNREYVVRIRANNGDQFLVQFRDKPSIRRGLETLRSSIDVSLDICIRPMPRHSTLPRRRRRARQVQVAS